MIEKNFQIPFVARLALNEKQIQQNYRPLIAVHKWFARRPGTLFRSLMLSEFADRNVDETYYRRHEFSSKRVFDPFMGGGTTVIEANRLGCGVTASDINPMAWWIVRQEVLTLDLEAYTAGATALRDHLRSEIGHLYKTTCPKTGELADVKYFLWVKQVKCGGCGQMHDLFPGHLIAQDVRHTANVFTCGHCGKLHESHDRKSPGKCPGCGKLPPVSHVAARNRSLCLHCGKGISYPTKLVPDHRLFAIEYHLNGPMGMERQKGRLFKSADETDLAKFREAADRLTKSRPRYIPEDQIPKGDESERLHRWGYHYYRELFNARQLLGLELSCRWIAKVKDTKVREALATNLSDLLRYQNMLCRYDPMALKSLDVFSVHGFPVGLMQCESNLLGIEGARGNPVGSGGWLNITEKFAKAKKFCVRPFEIRHQSGKKIEVPITGEWIGEKNPNGSTQPDRELRLLCQDSTLLEHEGKYDAIFTDPPYFGNVQYAELMDFCYVWLRRLVGFEHQEFAGMSTRNQGELTGNANMGRDLAHFTEGISKTFSRAVQQLRLGAPLSFTYHHNRLDAYVPLAVSILDTGLTCSASLPCPAEMGASIHINGTGSSVIDTVFVCRATGKFPKRWLVETPLGLAALIRSEIAELALAGLKATQGDIRCIAHGHLTRLAVWNLRKTWNRDLPATVRMESVRDWLRGFGGLEAVLEEMDGDFQNAASHQQWQLEGMVKEEMEDDDDISF